MYYPNCISTLAFGHLGFRSIEYSNLHSYTVALSSFGAVKPKLKLFRLDPWIGLASELNP